MHAYTRFAGGVIAAGQFAATPFDERQSWLGNSVLRLNDYRPHDGQLRGGVNAGVEFTGQDLTLCYVLSFANPNSGLKANPVAARPNDAREGAGAAAGKRKGPAGEEPQAPDTEQSEETNCIGALGEELNCLGDWTFFGPESDYDTSGADSAVDQPEPALRDGAADVRRNTGGGLSGPRSGH